MPLKRTKAPFLLLAVAFIQGCGEATAPAPSSPARAVPSHAQGPHADGWCVECRTGYVAGLGIPSFDLFETLDAHGHDIDPASIRCADCRQAMASGGFCDGCRMGFVKGKAYLSRLAYHAARGEVRDPSRLDCTKCAANARTHGWCDRCQVGMVGALAVFSRADLEGAREACARLEAALAMLERCETCAIAACTGGRCRACNKSYPLEPGR